jgi:multidrug efflux pump subunit AcrA (membrane-fusion protein)
MAEAKEVSTPSEQAFEQLDQYAEKSLQTAGYSDLLAEMPPQVERGVIYLIGLAVLVTACLLYFGKVHVVVAGKGKILPEGDVLTVQSLQSGVVNAVLARPGDRLPAGAPIVRLDVSERGMNLADLKRKLEIDQNQLVTMREAAVQLNRILADPDRGLSDRRPGAALTGTAMQVTNNLENALMRLESARQDLNRLPERKKLQQREIDLVREKITLLERNQKNEKAALAAEETALVQKKAQLQSFRGLAEKQLISPVEMSAEEEKYRAAENALTAQRNRIGQQDIEISNESLHLSDLSAKLQSMQTETEAAHRSAQVNHSQALAAIRQERENLRVQIQQTEAGLEADRGKIGLAESQLSLSTIQMPVAGTIVELKVKNRGDLVSTGPIAAVVPEGVPLVVEAEVPNKDIGFVKVGLAARIKVDAYPSQQFGTVPAQVTRVLQSMSGANFLVLLRLLDTKLGTKGNEVYLFPGLTVEAELLTSKQRMWNLLLSPESAQKGGASK